MGLIRVAACHPALHPVAMGQNWYHYFLEIGNRAITGLGIISTEPLLSCSRPIMFHMLIKIFKFFGHFFFFFFWCDRLLWCWWRFSVIDINTSVAAGLTQIIIIITVECCYNTVQYNMVLDIALQWLKQNINQNLDSQKTSHSLPSRASYGVSIVRILEKINFLIMTPHCIWFVILWRCYNESCWINEFEFLF